MRTFLYIVLGVILLTFGINRIMPTNDIQSRDQLIKDFVNGAHREVYNCDMGQVPYLDFMHVDGKNTTVGQVTFIYNDYTDIVLECYADSVRYNYSKYIDIDSIAIRERANQIRKCGEGYILAGDLRDEDGISVEGYNYYRKYICRNGHWIVYGVNYKYNDKDSLSRLFAMVDNY